MKPTLSIIFFMLSAISLCAQKETFDLATFTVPSGWKKTSNTTNVVGYTVTNNQKGTYCQIGIYASTTSKGNLQADFESEWQELVVKIYKSTTKPELIPSASENGWDAQGGAAPFEFSGAQAVAMLVTATSHGRCMSIVVVTNTEDYQTEIQNFLESVDLKKIEATSQPFVGSKEAPEEAKKQSSSSPEMISSFTFTTTNFDDGWNSTAQADWVKVVKGNITVLIHYPNKNVTEYNADVLEGLKNAWNILVMPKYSKVSNVEFKPVTGWQSIEFAEADAEEKFTGKSVHVVLFKMKSSNARGKYMEFITPDKKIYELEFGAYRQDSFGWEKVEAMANYNKFAVAATDLKGTWTTTFTGMTQYVNAYTGADAGATSHASNETFEFMQDNSYHWKISAASGIVGNAKFQNAKSDGKLSLPNNWQIHFSDIEGKPKTYNAFFSCVKGARILWIDGSAFASVMISK